MSKTFYSTIIFTLIICTLFIPIISSSNFEQIPIKKDLIFLGNSNYAWPIPGYTTLSSKFGKRIAPTTGASTFHKGIDIPGSAGTNIVAADAGKVLKVAKLTYGYGWHVIIDHGNGVATLYGHCSRLDVSVGQVVQKGQVIAGIGSTGNSTGNHVHFEVRINGVQQNPLNYVKQPS